MDSLNKLLKPNGKIPKWIPVLFLVISFLGFADASYLTIEHFRGVVPNCSILKGCEVVTTSSYSEIFGIPVALLGAFYYLTMLLLSIAFFDSKKERVLRLAWIITPLGFLASAYFSFLMIVVLKAICIYCVGSVITSTLLFIIGMYSLYTYRPQLQEHLP